MKFKVALEIVRHDIFEVEADNAQLIQDHWSKHELRQLPTCDCPIVLGNLLQTELVKWKILDLHPVRSVNEPLKSDNDIWHENQLACLRIMRETQDLIAFDILNNSFKKPE